MALRPGDLLNNRYRIIKCLAEGGFGAVYRAEDESLKTPCALKENLDYWEEAQKQFEREALLLASLRHPNLPRVTDYFIVPALGQYLVMDFVEGYDLQTILNRVRQPLAERQVLGWIDQICQALAYLHAQNPPIIHRDVKPANIKITPSGTAMLVDFGIAKRYDPGSKTIAAAQAVTPGYSPVEQYGNEITDVRADIYALGATLYMLLTAQRPLESIARVTGKTLRPPREINPNVTAAVEQVILRAMEIRAADRYPSVVDFREALMKSPMHPSGQVAAVSKALEEVPPKPISVGTMREPAPISPGKSVITKPLPPSHRSAVRMEWITIPEGEFLFGEYNRKVHLPAFQIAKYPVTNQQYKHFLSANPQHPAPTSWKEREFPLGKGHHPVVGVSYYDALAFCEWLGCRLPTEEEWEKAARGSEGYEYPWGAIWEDGKFCNNWEARIGGTTPVDKYKDGVSPFGVWDLVGNVWEWTSTPYQGPFMNVLRGGSWRLFSKYAMRATQRDWLLLEDSRDDVGFRCARSL